MQRDFADLSARASARFAGFGYLAIIACGLFAEFAVRGNMLVPGDAAATFANISAAPGLFRIGLASDIIMLIFDALVGWALYLLLRPIHRGLALLTLVFRLLHTAIYAATLVNMFAVTTLTGSQPFVTAMNAGQRASEVMMRLEANNHGYLIGLIIFGVHCLVLGWLILRSRTIPKLLGGLLALAGAMYLFDSFAHVLMVNYADYADVFLAMVAGPAIIAELSFSLWLIIRGGKVMPTESATTETA